MAIINNAREYSKLSYLISVKDTPTSHKSIEAIFKIKAVDKSFNVWLLSSNKSTEKAKLKMNVRNGNCPNSRNFSAMILKMARATIENIPASNKFSLYFSLIP
jgi:hypothetical protein